MTRRLLVSALPGEARAAWLEGEALADLVIQRDDRPGLLGNLYLGRIAKVDKGLNAAFVELGLARGGFLPLDEAPEGASEGETVAVKVLREGAAGKGPRLTARLKDPPPDLAARVSAARAPALLLRGDDPLERVLAARQRPEEIVTDDEAVFARLKGALGADLPAEVLRLDLDPVPLFERAGIEAEIEALLHPAVALPSGGSLLVEPVTTLTAIDVNTGRHDGRAGSEAAALAVNLEAAGEIARQLRLRALSGLIVIDFLALKQVEVRREVVAALRRHLKRDPEAGRVQPMAPSGLVETTRRRSRPPLHEMLTAPCGLGGGGRVRDPVTLAFEALRRLRAEAAARPAGDPAIRAAPAVIAALSGPAAAAREALEARLAKPIVLDEAPAAPGESAEAVIE